MTRKLILTVLSAIGLFFQSAHAQSGAAPRFTKPVKDTITKVSAGAKLGANFTQIDGIHSFKSGYNPGFTIGGFVHADRKKVGIQVEGLINYVTYNLQDTFLAGGHLNALSFDVPILFEYNFIPHLWIQAGPQFSTLLSVTRSNPGYTDPRTLFQSFNISGVVGLEVRLPHKLCVGARYVYGFLSVTDQGNGPAETWKTSAAQAYLGLKLY